MGRTKHLNTPWSSYHRRGFGRRGVSGFVRIREDE